MTGETKKSAEAIRAAALQMGKAFADYTKSPEFKALIERVKKSIEMQKVERQKVIAEIKHVGPIYYDFETGEWRVKIHR